MQFYKEKFIIVKELKKLTIDLEKVTVNFPKKDYLIKDGLYNNLFNIIELVYEANYSSDNEKRKELQLEILSKINLLDFVFELSFKRKYISEKQCISYCSRLEQITKMIYGWIKDE